MGQGSMPPAAGAHTEVPGSRRSTSRICDGRGIEVSCRRNERGGTPSSFVAYPRRRDGAWGRCFLLGEHTRKSQVHFGAYPGFATVVESKSPAGETRTPILNLHGAGYPQETHRCRNVEISCGWNTLAAILSLHGVGYPR